MILPSRELLSAVLQKEISGDDVCPIHSDENNIKYFAKQKCLGFSAPIKHHIDKKILAMLIIEWIPNDYKLLCHKTDAGWYSMLDKETEEGKITFMEGYFQTAPEAIYRAGEWILGKLNG